MTLSNDTSVAANDNNIDQHICKKTKTRRNNFAMAWIDNKKSHDMVAKTWIIESLKHFTISDKLIKFINETGKLIYQQEDKL